MSLLVEAHDKGVAGLEIVSEPPAVSTPMGVRRG